MFARFRRWFSASGLAFAILALGATLLTADSPRRAATDADLLAYYGNSGERDRELVALILIGLAVLAFLWFLGGLRAELGRAEGEPARLTTIVTASGAVFIALAAAAHAAGAAPAVTADYFDAFTLEADSARLFLATSYLLFVLSLFAAAAMTLAASVVAFSTRAWPRWLAASGFVATLGGLLGLVVWPSLAVLAWIVLVSTYLLVPEPDEDRASGAVPIG